MMRSPDEELADLESQKLRRKLRKLDSPQGGVVTWEGKRYHNFSSNDYLGLAEHPQLKAALVEGIERFGAGSGASRLICGTLAPHTELEEALAAFKRTEAALVFSSGYATAVGVLSALLGKGDIVILDKLCHASLIDGARLSGATIRVYPHNDLDKLGAHLEWAADRVEGEGGRILVVTESVFSMDGDRAPLRDIVELKERKGAWLLVDEAHAFGVIGEGGRGLGSDLEIEDGRIDLQMGTLSKAAGLSGGYLAASRSIVDLLVNRARSFIYSTAPPPGIAYAGQRALEIIAGPEGDARRMRLQSRVEQLTRGFGIEAESAVVPVVLGTNEAALEAGERLRERGFLIPAIRYPTVPRGTARLRITLSAAHEVDQVEELRKALGEVTSLESVPPSDDE